MRIKKDGLEKITVNSILPPELCSHFTFLIYGNHKIWYWFLFFLLFCLLDIARKQEDERETKNADQIKIEIESESSEEGSRNRHTLDERKEGQEFSSFQSDAICQHEGTDVHASVAKWGKSFLIRFSPSRHLAKSIENDYCNITREEKEEIITMIAEHYCENKNMFQNEDFFKLR